ARRTGTCAGVPGGWRPGGSPAGGPGGWPDRTGREADPGSGWSGPSRCAAADRSEEHTSELQSREKLVCRLLLEKKKEHDYRQPSLPTLSCLAATRDTRMFTPSLHDALPIWARRTGTCAGVPGGWRPGGSPAGGPGGWPDRTGREADPGSGWSGPSRCAAADTAP